MMNMDEINSLSTAIIAFSTFVGVGFGIAGYMKEIQGIGSWGILSAIIIYILIGVILTIIIRNQIS